MEHLIVPAGYEPAIDLRETQIAIKIIKDFFQRELAKQLHLTRVSAPLFDLESGSRRIVLPRLSIPLQSGNVWR